MTPEELRKFIQDGTQHLAKVSELMSLVAELQPKIQRMEQLQKELGL